MLDKFKWPEPEHKADETIIRNIRKHGCHIVGIMADDEGPPYAFSIGLFLNYGHPEIVIFGLDGTDAASVINDIRDRAAKGQKCTAGEVSDGLLIDCKACFIEVPLERYRDYLGTAIWFYAKSPPPVSLPATRVAGSRRTISLAGKVRSGAEILAAAVGQFFLRS